MMLHVVSSIQQDLSHFNTSQVMWNHLRNTYGVAMPTSVYKDFKEALNLHINPSQHPDPQMDKMQACFQHLCSNSITIPNQIQAMMLLATIPQKWEMLITIVTQSRQLRTLNFTHVCKAILLQHKGKFFHGKDGNNKQ